jgi:hypothetical protein
MFMSLELYKRSRNFKVSNTCRTLLLYTRATAFSHAGYSHPGLFDLQRYELDTLAFALAFFCEIAGLWAIYSVLGDSFGAAAGFFVADFLLVFLHHLCIRPLRLADNVRQAFTGNPAFVTRWENRRSRNSFLSWTLVALIFLVCLMKIYMFYFGLCKNDPNPPLAYVLTLFVTYAIVAIVHCTCTGYWCAAGLLSFFLDRSRKKWADADDPSALAPHPIEVAINTHGESVTSWRDLVGQGWRAEFDQAARTLTVTFTGFIFDSDIDEVANRIHNDVIKGQFLREAHRSQLEVAAVTPAPAPAIPGDGGQW